MIPLYSSPTHLFYVSNLRLSVGKRIFEALGPQFIRKLLHSSKKSTGINEYQTLAINILYKYASLQLPEMQ